jgi:hypothetical protein
MFRVNTKFFPAQVVEFKAFRYFSNQLRIAELVCFKKSLVFLAPVDAVPLG